MKPFVPRKLPFSDIEWGPLVPLIGKANRALAHYDGVLKGVPNPEVLLAPLTTQEAVLSSKIEGTQATFGEVLRFEAGEEPKEERRRDDIWEILNYRKALWTAEEELKSRPFSLNLVKTLHDILLSSVRGKDKGRGRFRTTQNWIGKFNSPMEEAEFVPPEPLTLMPHMDNWEKYYHADEPDPLVQLAIVHAQFEIIHPFLDGNGRLGRIVIPLFLFEKNILNRPMFYMSEYLEERRDDYVGYLRALDNKFDTWRDWIEFFLHALVEQAQTNTEKALAIMDLYSRLKEEVRELTHSQYAIPLLDQLFSRPLFQSKSIDLGDHSPSRQAIANMLRRLREADILQVVVEGRGRKAQILVLGELYNLCES